MSEVVDARGLSCPQPVLNFLDTAKKVSSGEITVLVDTDTSKENVTRAAESQGWQAKDVQAEGSGYRMRFAKG